MTQHPLGTERFGHRGGAPLVVATLASFLVATVACNPGNALKVPQPDNLNSATLNSPAALPALLAGTLSAFQIAYSGAADEGNGGHEGYINWSGIFTDEMESEETFPTRIVVDERIGVGGQRVAQGVLHRPHAGTGDRRQDGRASTTSSSPTPRATASPWPLAAIPTSCSPRCIARGCR